MIAEDKLGQPEFPRIVNSLESGLELAQLMLTGVSQPFAARA
jgi:hypothetical protein